MPEGTGPLTASELIGTPDLGGVLEQYFGFDEGTGGKYTQFFDPYDPTAFLLLQSKKVDLLELEEV
jgi:hypothetical protein